LEPKLSISEKNLEKWNSIVNELKQEKPIQYILGETEFFGLRFLVNENTLIPRQETEELVELVIKESSQIEILNPKILDIGTGSGCIAISLAKNLTNSKVYALDVSDKALEIAKQNAMINEVEINFITKSILEVEDLGQLTTHNSQLSLILLFPILLMLEI